MARESTIQILYGNAATTAPADLSDGEFAFAHGNEKLFIGANGDNTAVWVGAEILDEDTFSSDSDVALATQQSIKAYVDSAIGASAGVVSIEGLNGVIDLDANTGITLATSGGDTITFSGTDATTSAKGVASFASADFSVSSGAVSLGDDVVKDITTDSGALTPSGHAFSLLGGEGMNVTHAGATITVAGEDATDSNKGIASFSGTYFTVTSGDVAIDDATTSAKGIASFASADFSVSSGAVSLSDTVLKAITTDTGGMIMSGHAISLLGGEGMDVTHSGTSITIAGEDASTTNKGVASFTSGDFTASSGAISLNDAVVKSITTDSGGLTPSTHAFSILGGEGMDVTHTGTTITVAGEDASTSNKGVASFSSDNFAVASGAVTIKDGGVANAELENSSIVISDGAGNTSDISLGGTLTIEGTTNEVTVAESAGTVTIGLPDDVTIAGNLTVNGTVTTIDTTNLVVEDPLIKLASNNNATDSVDIGFFGLYDTSGSQDLYAGLFRDANDSGKFKLFTSLQSEPTTTVNTAGTGYAVGTLVAKVSGGSF